jgi:hypothetical protein
MPRYPHQVKITTPAPRTSPPATDPATGNELPTPPATVAGQAYLAQKPVAVLGSGTELAASQRTTITSATMLVPPATVLTDESIVEDVDGVVNGEPGSKWRVEGTPATRTSRLGAQQSFRAASLRLISDLQ